MIAVALTVALVLFIFWQMGGFESRIPPGEAGYAASTAPAGRTARAREITIPLVEEAVGTIQSRHKVDISPQIQATINEILVNAGETAHQGDVLVRLDRRDLDARTGQAEQAVQAADANHKQAATDFSRTRELLARGVVSAQEADNARLKVEVTSATVGEARRGLEQARVALSYAEIRSPVSGVVTDKFQNAGDMGMPGRPILSLYDPSLVRLEAPVREAVVRHLKNGDPVKVRLGSEDVATTGIVDEIVPQADVASRSVLVKVLVPNAASLYSGMFGRLLVETGAENVLVVPAEAVEQVGQLEYLLIPSPTGAERRFVQTGRRFGGDVEVLAGLSRDEQIILPPAPTGSK